MNNNNSNYYRLGQILINKQIITTKQLEYALDYQKNQGGRLGEVLIGLNLITESQLKQALNNQNHLRTWAACLALMVPVSLTYAYEPEYEGEDNHWTSHQITPSEEWPHHEYQYDTQQKPDIYGQALAVAWGMYQGLPEQGKWRYSFGKTQEKGGYQVKFKLSF